MEVGFTMIQNPGISTSSSLSGGAKRVTLAYAIFTSAATIGTSSNPTYLTVLEDANWEDIALLHIDLIINMYGSSYNLDICICGVHFNLETLSIYSMSADVYRYSGIPSPYFGNTIYTAPTNYLTTSGEGKFMIASALSTAELTGSILNNAKVYSNSSEYITTTSPGSIIVSAIM